MTRGRTQNKSPSMLKVNAAMRALTGLVGCCSGGYQCHHTRRPRPSDQWRQEHEARCGDRSPPRQEPPDEVRRLVLPRLVQLDEDACNVTSRHTNRVQ
ncbi:hypothetical protein RHA1_ro08463 (plasmid) [Rhodococcus jostii RHA1]|uniref:Uncharacterized protein n=1 Tax=Rhodococcus jostii (strain RHA1) TaxID=101510 RepID=Q0RYX9_RHOJR|nr:hypothetical protein RHA1_ro08463 [Rhodococcus jostii RHA1]